MNAVQITEAAYIPSIWTHVIFWTSALDGSRIAYVSGIVYLTKKDAEQGLAQTHKIWDKNGRENLTVSVREFAPVPF